MRQSPSSALDGIGVRIVSRSGGELRIRECPERGTHERANVSINARSGAWKCHACDVGGSLDELLARLAELERTPADDRDDDERTAPAINFEALWNVLARSHPDGARYLAGRALDPTLLAGVVRYAVALGHPALARCNGEPALPLRDLARGEVVGIQYRPATSKPRTVSGSHVKGSALHGKLTDIDLGCDVVIVEGLADTLAASLAFPGAVVFGAPGASQLAAVMKAVATVAKGEAAMVYLVPDDDEPGASGAADAIIAASDAGLVLDRDLHVVGIGEHHDLADAWRADSASVSLNRRDGRGADRTLAVACERLDTRREQRGARVVWGTEVKHKRVQWLWRGRIPRGFITVIDGNPGLGKSLATLDIAARVTTGAPMPDDDESAAREPRNVVLMTAEDTLATVHGPRLKAAGADPARWCAISAMPTPHDPNALATLAPEHVARLGEVVRETSAALVVIDPLMAFLPSAVDSYRDQDVRRVLRPLATIAELYDVAIIIVRHVNKAAGPAIYRGGGSIGIAGAARSVLLVAKDDQSPSDTRALASTKSNLDRPAQTLRYKVTGWSEDSDIPVIEWLGTSDATADDLANWMAPRPTDGEATREDLAADALRELLANGPRPTVEVVRDVHEMTGARPRTIERARQLLGVVPAKVGNTWTLALPAVQLRHTADGGGVDARDEKTPCISAPIATESTPPLPRGGVAVADMSEGAAIEQCPEPEHAL